MENDLKMYNPPHPGEVLKELYIEPLGITLTAVAEHLGVRRATISAIVNGKSAISPTMAIRLGKAFATSPDLWLGIQSQYDLWQVRLNYSADDVKLCC